MEGRILISENISLEYPTGKVGFLRCLVDPAQEPGDVNWSCAVVISDNMELRAAILKGGKRPMTISEVKLLKEYFQSQGCHGGWGRYHNGKPHKEIYIEGK